MKTTFFIKKTLRHCFYLRYLSAIFILLLFSYCVNATIYRTTGTGIWNNTNNWVLGNIPPTDLSITDTIIIEHHINYGNTVIEVGGFLKVDDMLYSTFSKEINVLPTGMVNVTDSLIVNKIINEGTINNWGYIFAEDFNNNNIINNWGWIEFQKTFNNNGYIYNYGTVFSPSNFINNGGTMSGDGGVYLVDGNLIDNAFGSIFCNGTNGIDICTSWGDPPSIISSSGYIDTSCVTFCGLPIGGVGLPVELLSFNVTRIGKFVLLNWKTATESNNDYFEIQNSYDGKNWQIIGVKYCSNPNSTVIKFYEFRDSSEYPEAINTVYYRLKQIDIDGGFEILPIVALNIKQNLGVDVTMYPNPSNNNIKLELYDTNTDNSSALIQIYNTFGMPVLEKEVELYNYTEFTIDISNFEVGTYFVNINIGKESIKEKLIVVVNN